MLFDRDRVRIFFYNSHLTARTYPNYLIPHYAVAITVGLYASIEQIPDHSRFSFAKLTALARYEHYRHTGNVVGDADTQYTPAWIASEYLGMIIQAQEPTKWPAQALIENTLALDPALKILHKGMIKLRTSFGLCLAFRQSWVIFKI